MKTYINDMVAVGSILPKHYELKEFDDAIRCTSRIGVSDAKNDDAWKTMVFEPLKAHFGERFKEVYHSTCANHLDFTIYFKPDPIRQMLLNDNPPMEYFESGGK